MVNSFHWNNHQLITPLVQGNHQPPHCGCSPWSLGRWTSLLRSTTTTSRKRPGCPGGAHAEPRWTGAVYIIEMVINGGSWWLNWWLNSWLNWWLNWWLVIGCIWLHNNYLDLPVANGHVRVVVKNGHPLTQVFVVVIEDGFMMLN